MTIITKVAEVVTIPKVIAIEGIIHVIEKILAVTIEAGEERDGKKTIVATDGKIMNTVSEAEETGVMDILTTLTTKEEAVHAQIIPATSTDIDHSSQNAEENAQPIDGEVKNAKKDANMRN